MWRLETHAGARLPGFTSYLYHLPAVGPGAMCITSLCLGFLRCKWE